MVWILLLASAASVLWRVRHKLPLLLAPLLLGAAPPPSDAGQRPEFEDALLELMLKFKMPKGSAEEGLSDAEKRARWRPLVEGVYAQCQRYEEETKVKAETCASIAINGAYWETGLQQRLQLEPHTGPSGEECYFQLHRAAEAVPFERWRPVHEYGTRHGEDLTRCVEDGVRAFAYHLWRCHLDEDDLRLDPVGKLWLLYSEYYLPTPSCRHYSLKGPIVNRSRMGARLIKRLPPSHFR